MNKYVCCYCRAEIVTRVRNPKGPSICKNGHEMNHDQAIIIEESFEELFGQRVAKWFDDRKIRENGSLLTQYSKLREEVEELRVSIIVENDGDPIKIIDFKDAIGDCAVVLAGMAYMAGMTFEECCEHAWNEIKDRTGHLNEDGVFVKD